VSSPRCSSDGPTPVVARHLRGWWREYGVLGQVRHRWYVTVISAWLGAVTHGLWDDFTHDGLAGTSLGFAVLGRPMVPGIPWWDRPCTGVHAGRNRRLGLGDRPHRASRAAEALARLASTGRRTARTVLGVGGGEDDAGRRRLRPVPRWAYPGRLLRTVPVCVAGPLVLTATVVVPLADYVTRYVVLRRSVPSRPSMFDESNGTTV
jgi:hypothetical protein